MSLSSMTGFGRSSGEWKDYHWAWEIRSVNSRNLDIRARIPSSMDGLEQEVRKRVTGAVSRGSIQINFHFKKHGSASEIVVNQDALDQVLALITKLKDKVEATPASLDGILNVRGVIEVSEPEESDEEKSARLAAMLSSFDVAVVSLVEARHEEGVAMKRVVEGQVTEITQLTERAEDLAATQPQALQKRLQGQIEDLLQDKTALSDDRLAQEVAILVSKADVREELDRLKAHCEAAMELLAKDGPVGRKLDFLTQEFNRESNTLCSKSTDVELTRIGLDLKTVVDQMREQVQNIE